MEIISWDFLIFISIVLIVYYFLNRKAQNFWLFLTSVFFFCTWGWPTLIPFFFVGGITFIIGKKLNLNKNKKWLIVGISINLSLFTLFRILNSPLFSFSNQVSVAKSSSFLNQFLIPIGFSFYVLQAISYLLDVYNTKISAEPDAIDFFVYLIFFPKILAGPIERSGSFLPQLKNERFVDNSKAIRAFTLILIGLFRKIVIAEVILSILPTNYIHGAVINTHPSLGFVSFPFYTYTESIPYLNRLAGIFAYGIYLYNDFAGYTGIVRGISLLMGFEIISNFQIPYFSYSLSDFWSRWHISLSSWLRDYIYFPITRSLKKRSLSKFLVIPIVIPIFITMLLSSLWHGLTIPLLIWGLTYAIVMVLEQFAFQKWPGLRPQHSPLIGKLFSTVLTFLIVTFAWVPFTAASVGEILAFWKVILKGSGWNSPPDFNFWILVLIFVSFVLDFLQFIYKDEVFIIKWPLFARASILAIFILVLILSATWTSQYTSNVFIYQGF